MRTVYKLGLLTKRREQIRRLLLPYAGEPVRTLTQVALEPVLQVVTEKDSDINRVWFDDDPMSGIPEADEVRTQALRMRASVESCFQFLRGSTFTEDDVLDMSYLLAGWWDKIRTGIRYAPWDPKQPTWALVRIVDLYPVDRLKAYRVYFRCEAGKPVMARWSTTLTAGWLGWLGKASGFRVYDSLNIPEDVSGFYFAAVVGTDERGRISVRQPETDSSLLSHNRKLAYARVGPCEGPADRKTCGICRYGRDKCRLGRWAMSFVKETTCVNGHKGLFREDLQSDKCLACLYGKKKGK